MNRFEARIALFVLVIAGCREGTAIDGVPQPAAPRDGAPSAVPAPDAAPTAGPAADAAVTAVTPGAAATPFPAAGGELRRVDSVLVGTRRGLVGHGEVFVGDMDGDGISEIAVANRDYRADGDAHQRGAVHLVYGRRAFPARIELGTEPTLEADVVSAPGELQVAPAGDVDGDGLADLLVSFPRPYLCREPGGLVPPVGKFSGTFLVYGSKARVKGRVHLGDAAVKLEAADPCADAAFGLAGVGDVDRDGLADFAVGVGGPSDGLPKGLGYVRLIYGQRERWAGVVALGSVGAELRGSPTGVSFGQPVNAAGDVDGDGHADFLIQESFSARGSCAVRSRAYLVRGARERFAGTVRLAPETPTFEAPCSIWPMAALGDIDGDGIEDIGIAEGLATKASLFHGRRQWPAGTIQLSAAEASLGPAAMALAAAGDVNGDGKTDFLVGNADFNRGAGISYLVLGSATRLSGAVTVDAISVRIPGPAPMADPRGGSPILGLAGATVAGGKDVNGDGAPDIAIGVPENHIGDDRGGEVHLLFGYRAPVP
jgi:hypothetical protein